MSQPPPAPSLLKRIYYTLALHWFIHRKITLTTTSSDGHALLVAYPPASMARKGWRGFVDKVWGFGFDLVFGGISWGVGLFDSGRVKRVSLSSFVSHPESVMWSFRFSSFVRFLAFSLFCFPLFG